jgi:hypothetical protein
MNTATITSAAFPPGNGVPVDLLLSMGFTPLRLEVHTSGIALPGGPGCAWDTLGVVPDSAGQYLFSQQAGVDPLHLPQPGERVNVTYSGCTTHLFMVTHGYRPHPRRPRGPQRYGRPVHAGPTRKRVNQAVTRAVTHGLTVHHWVRPVKHDPAARTPGAALLAAEEALIAQWQLRTLGWNRR